jgi:beta-lactam-binding protein with PASTA domain
MSFNFDSIESYVSNHLKLFISLIIWTLIFVGLVAVAVFFIAVRGSEQTMIPDIQGKELTQALMELQVKELYPKIQLRYSQSALDKGTVMEQDPLPGTIVKAGRRIRLVVSQGVIVDTLGDYIGRNIDDVRMEIQAIAAAAGQQFLSLKEPFLYEFSTEEAGTILQQNPESGFSVSGPTSIDFVISKGPENAMIKAPDLVGLPIADAIEQIAQSGVAFNFSVRESSGNGASETVVSQVPAGGTIIEANRPIDIVVSAPSNLAANENFGLFSFTLPENPYALAVRLEALLPNGERRRLAAMDHLGGEITIPYRLPIGSTLILTMLNREMVREEVRAPERTPVEVLN